MYKIRFFYSVCFIVVMMYSNAQTISPSVINTAGGGGIVGASNTEIYYNIGEPFITTLSQGFSDLTQGFLQPNLVGKVALNITPLISSESCLNENDGKIILTLNAEPENTNSKKYIWYPVSICPSQNCASVDSLSPGSYSVTVIAYDINALVLDSIKFTYDILKSTEPCLVKVYNGFTPNGDGVNDHFRIDNIENYPINKVIIYNRWGVEIATFNNYDNDSNVWKGEALTGNIVPAGTYFYVIEIGNAEAFKKGWVEVTY